MYSSVIAVIPRGNYILELTFSNGVSGVLDMKPYLDFGIFNRLKDCNNFEKVTVAFDAIEWESGADLDPEFVYDKCKKNQPNKTLSRSKAIRRFIYFLTFVGCSRLALR